jgi:hypothetical protein
MSYEHIAYYAKDAALQQKCCITDTALLRSQMKRSSSVLALLLTARIVASPELHKTLIT